MKVPMLDLSEQYASLKSEVLEALDGVMSSSQFILGSNVKKLEADIAAYSHVAHGIGCGNGSDAIHIALQAAGLDLEMKLLQLHLHSLRLVERLLELVQHRYMQILTQFLLT